MYYAYIIYKNKKEIRESGIVENWEECKEKIYKRPAKFKKFGRLDDAEEFIRENGAWSVKKLLLILTILTLSSCTWLDDEMKDWESNTTGLKR